MIRKNIICGEVEGDQGLGGWICKRAYPQSTKGRRGFGCFADFDSGEETDLEEPTLSLDRKFAMFEGEDTREKPFGII